MQKERCMPGIGISLSRLRTLRDLFERHLKAASGKWPRNAPARPSRLHEITNFGSNPGNLRMHVFVPVGIDPSPALVIALHGCTQTADAYDHGAGWSDLADRLGFILVFPEQQAANNPKSCFSWFLPGDIARDSGEALSIREMIAKAVDKYGVDRSRIFVTGLSAGGAMASVMLAVYPEIFAGGAIIAGLPYGSASSVQEAFEAMFNERAPSTRALGDHVRAASKHRGPWPKISVWHGAADTVVRPSNADHIVRQWLDVQKLPERPSSEERIGQHTRRVWKDANGGTCLEAYSIAGMPHGVPLATAGVDGCGLAGPFFLEAGISSTVLIARSWGLDAGGARKTKTQRESAVDRAPAAPALYPALGHDAAAAEALRAQNNDSSHGTGWADPGTVIEAAFKAAGLPVPERTSGRMIDPAPSSAPWTMTDELRVPRKIKGTWEPFNPSQWRAYAPRQRLFRTPNDAFMTGNFHVPKSLIQAAMSMQGYGWVQLLLASVYSGTFHPTAEGQAAIADAVVAQARTVLSKYEDRTMRSSPKRAHLGCAAAPVSDPAKPRAAPSLPSRSTTRRLA
jgi:poly(hydroxyalkanoate) depolymerase family esterase